MINSIFTRNKIIKVSIETNRRYLREQRIKIGKLGPKASMNVVSIEIQRHESDQLNNTIEQITLSDTEIELTTEDEVRNNISEIKFYKNALHV